MSCTMEGSKKRGSKTQPHLTCLTVTLYEKKNMSNHYMIMINATWQVMML